MGNQIATVVEDVRHERSLIILLSLTYPEIIKQSKFTDDEIDITRTLASEKVHRQRIKEDGVFVSVIEKPFLLKNEWHIEF